ncbi:hypothetical protein HFP57_09700 [Parasphingopyxis algicola]|uniref:hypothetical protein n=1 Tax=Parasphingopyxis algicola TaxID=2026624 RepID=UPI00159F8118|nr:hypothetical protein [Parasphingopyxis algicola]QLC25266.1 hypothetical protein HFP57_09700 [Parasphingopyxis algicola]
MDTGILSVERFRRFQMRSICANNTGFALAALALATTASTTLADPAAAQDETQSALSAQQRAQAFVDVLNEGNSARARWVRDSFASMARYRMHLNQVNEIARSAEELTLISAVENDNAITMSVGGERDQTLTITLFKDERRPERYTSISVRGL